jgi:hypothetical protein
MMTARFMRLTSWDFQELIGDNPAFSFTPKLTTGKVRAMIPAFSARAPYLRRKMTRTDFRICMGSKLKQHSNSGCLNSPTKVVK